LEETRELEISTSGEASGEWVKVNVEGNEIEISIFIPE